MTDIVAQTETNDTQLSVDEICTILDKIYRHESHILNEKIIFDQIKAHYKNIIDNAQKNFEIATQEDKTQIEELKLKLQRYYDANPPKGRKSLKFGNYSFGYNKAQTKYFFNGGEVNADNAELVKFCYSNGLPEFVKTKEYLDWAGLKKNLDFDNPDVVVFAATGEVIDGLRAQKVFSVKTL